MKNRVEKLLEIRFFRSINEITRKFFSKEDIDIEQLEELSKSGKIKTVFQTVSSENIFEIIKTVNVNDQELHVLKITRDIKGFKFVQILEKNFEPFFIGANKTKSFKFFEKQVKKEILSDSKIYAKTVGLKKLRFPKVFSFQQNEDKGNYFLAYSFHLSGGGQRDGFVEEYIVRAGYRGFSFVPLLLSESTLVFVGKKK